MEYSRIFMIEQIWNNLSFCTSRVVVMLVRKKASRSQLVEIKEKLLETIPLIQDILSKN